MKIRDGFVSNSSSSSFIVAFPHKPKSVKDLKEMMFGKQEWHYVGIYGEKGSSDYPTQDIAEAVFRDIKEKATKEQIFESIRDGWFDAYLIPSLCPGRYSYSDKIIKLDWKNIEDRKKIESFQKEADDINDKRALDIAETFINSSKNQYVVVLAYGDDDGRFGSILEHSGIFDRIGHIRTSYH